MEDLIEEPAQGEPPPSEPEPERPTKKKGLLRRLYDWVLHWADTPYGTPALGLLSFAESSVFPLPPDPLLIALSVAKPKRAFRYAAVCTAASVLGGIAGYAIGYFVWQEVQGFFFTYVFSEELFNEVSARYNQYGFALVFAAGLTPLPYKVATITAGAAQIAFPAFVFASIVGRSARFFLVAGLIRLFGPAIREKIEAHFDAVAWAFLALLVLGFVVVKWLV